MTKSTALDRSRLRSKIGKKPGSLSLPETNFIPRYFLIAYTENEVQEFEFTSYTELKEYVQKNTHFKFWIDIRGLGDLEMLQSLINDFDIHPLQMEDVVNDYQRPKMEEENDRLFLVSRMIELTPGFKVDDDQLSLFTGPNYVISLQSDYDDILETLRVRIRNGKGVFRKRPPVYLAYAIIDVVVDHYYLVMSDMNLHFEQLEADLLDNPSKKLFNKLLDARRELIKIRRIVWPERDKINEILKLDNQTIPKDIRPYFKDVYDHCVYLIDLIESYKDVSSNLMELYISSVNTRMNEVMKVLTIISSIFIPLSFVAGVYGMNFSRHNPETGTVYRLNMPELYQPWGYMSVIALMVVMASLQIWYFYRKGWLRNS